MKKYVGFIRYLQTFQSGSIQLLNIDCMEYMATLPDKAFDLAIVDPPYGIHEKLIRCGNSRPFSNLYKQNQWDKQRPDKAYFVELQRVSINQVICGGNYFADLLPASRGWVIWSKLGEGISTVNDELIYTSFDKAIQMFQRSASMDKGFLNPEVKNIHPTQKPVKLYEWLLRNFAKPKQRVLDTHLGSGSSAIAAHYFGVDFVGCEIDTDYFNAAKQRFERQTRQTAMFGYEDVA
jgi:site-specific DNA-methyltransferase (adenine-specific)